MTAVPPWLDWGRRLAAIAREGLTWSREPFDRDRYDRGRDAVGGRNET